MHLGYADMLNPLSCGWSRAELHEGAAVNYRWTCRIWGMGGIRRRNVLFMCDFCKPAWILEDLGLCVCFLTLDLNTCVFFRIVSRWASRRHKQKRPLAWFIQTWMWIIDGDLMCFWCPGSGGAGWRRARLQQERCCCLCSTRAELRGRQRAATLLWKRTC